MVKNMNMLLFCFIYLLVATYGDQVSQNSSQICQKCRCTGSGDAQTLDCSSQTLSKIIQSWPWQNSTIKAIFTNNNFQTLDKLPPTNSTLEIVLSKCNIKTLSPGLFTEAPNIKFVDLSYNLLTSEEVTSDKFKGPVGENGPRDLAIEDLNLAYNQIHSLAKNIFENMPNLKRLNLEGNDFTVLDVQTQLALVKVPGLTTLNLANNELTDLVPEAIEHLTSLIELDLSKNDLDYVPYDLKLVGQTLEKLILDENPILEITAETFTGLVNLLELSANNLTKLRQIKSGSFAPCLKLTKLSLCNDSLEEIDSKAFAPNSTLKELYISNNNLTRISPSLLKWSQLDTIHLEDNPWECSCDLYNISSALSDSVTRNQNGPTCLDLATGRRLQIYSLGSDICASKIGYLAKKIAYHHFSVPLAGLITVLVIGLFVAISLGHQRYRQFVARQTNDPFVSQVVYSPLLNARS